MWSYPTLLIQWFINFKFSNFIIHSYTYMFFCYIMMTLDPLFQSSDSYNSMFSTHEKTLLFIIKNVKMCTDFFWIRSIILTLHGVPSQFSRIKKSKKNGQLDTWFEWKCSSHSMSHILENVYNITRQIIITTRRQ